MLDILLALNRELDRFVMLNMDKKLQPMSLRKSFNDPLTMLPDSTR